MENKDMTKLKKNATTLGYFIGTIGTYLLIGFIAYKCYNNIAYNFNLPTLNYLTCAGTFYVLNRIFSSKK